MEANNLTLHKIANRSAEKFYPRLYFGHISRVINNKTNAATDIVMKLCESSGLTPNEVIVGRWNNDPSVKLKQENQDLKQMLEDAKLEIEYLKARIKSGV